MRIYALILALFPLVSSANDYIGIPIGGYVDPGSTRSETRASAEIIIEGPFEGVFSVFDRYKAQLSIRSGLLIMAEAEKLYLSFEPCANETRRIWRVMEQKYGKPALDENQVWWFDIGNRQKISINCRIYGASGKIALNIIAVDSGLAVANGKEQAKKKIVGRLRRAGQTSVSST